MRKVMFEKVFLWPSDLESDWLSTYYHSGNVSDSLPRFLRVPKKNHINKHRKIVCCLFLARPISINQCNRIKKLIFESRKKDHWMSAVKLFDIFIVIEKVCFSTFARILWDFIVMYYKLWKWCRLINESLDECNWQTRRLFQLEDGYFTFISS